TPPVLWLAWDALHGQPSYKDEVKAWLSFARDHLATAGFEGFRVVASMAIEAENKAFEALAKGLPRLRSQGEYWTDRFRCTAIEPLGAATRDEVLAFLEQNGCDPGDVRALADAIFAKTEGRYEATVALLREGLRLGWRVLLRQFGTPAGSDPLDF